MKNDSCLYDCEYDCSDCEYYYPVDDDDFVIENNRQDFYIEWFDYMEYFYG